MAVSLLPKGGRLWLTACLALTACAACAGIGLWQAGFEAGGRRGPVWGKYEKVKLGMTEKQVKGILGLPDDHFGGGLMDLDLTWFEGEQTITVRFGSEDRATEKHFRPGRAARWVNDPPESLTDHVWDWLGR
jgi:hypothetical protein